MTKDDFVDTLKATIESGWDIQEGAKISEVKNNKLLIKLEDDSGFLISSTRLTHLEVKRIQPA